MKLSNLSKEQLQTLGDQELHRLESGHRRAMRWLKAHPGEKPPFHIIRCLHESRVFEELQAAQDDYDAREEWQKNGGDSPPPLPTAGKVAVPPKQSMSMVLALEARNRRNKSCQS